MKSHIAFGGIHIESTTFTSYISDKQDFKITTGDELMERYPWLKTKDYNITCSPLIHARAIPGGVVSKSIYTEWLHEFMKLLKDAMLFSKVDGVLLDIHGAMSVEGMDDAEGDLASLIREVVGEDVVISTSMDLHGNVSDKLFNSCDLLTCYRTAPHIDQVETRKRAFDNMIEVLTNKTDVVKAKVDLPILLPGEKTSTDVEPGKTLYQKLQMICEDKGIIDASIWMGFPWADQERCHSAIVITGTDEQVVTNEIKELATYYWNIRHQFEFVGPTASIERVYEEALKSNVKPFFISDTGDNPGAGGSGDLNIMLKLALSFEEKLKNKRVLFSSIFDSESVHVVYSNKDKKYHKLRLGGKVDPQFGSPLEIEVRTMYLFTDETAGKCAVVRNGNIDIIITEKRYQYGTKKAYHNAGVIDSNMYDIIVVKMGYLEPDLKEMSDGWIMALSDGAVNQDLKHIKYQYLSRPVYPLDEFEHKINIKVTK